MLINYILSSLQDIYTIKIYDGVSMVIENIE